MKFTIFTGFYNYLETVDDLVNSILNQTHTDWEWIIWDDFSENQEVSVKLQEICKIDSRVKQAFPETKKQFYWNPPTNLATGDVCLVQDSDDIMLPNLLKVYDYNFNKFQDVQLISCNSELRTDNIHGILKSFRLINYKEVRNLKESIFDPTNEYSFGDSRAWRNNIELFTNENFIYCAEDIIKELVCEKKGKLLFLPRTLSIYSWRNNSISRTMDAGVYDENKVILDTIGADNENLETLEKYYDNIYDHAVCFYNLTVNHLNTSEKINYLCTDINDDVKDKLNCLFFDQEIKYNDENNYEFVVSKIKTKSDLDILKNYFYNYKITKELSIVCDISLKHEVFNFLESNNLMFYWFGLDNFFTIKINF